MTGSPATPVRSIFVTVVAWVFIIFSGLATLISLLQNLMFASVNSGAFDKALQDSTLTPHLPSSSRFMFSHFRLMLLVGLVVFAATLISSVGLLRRQDWARLLFIGILALGIVYFGFTIVLQQSMLHSMTTEFSSGAGKPPAQLQSMFGLFKVVMYVIEVGFAAVFAWILLKLLSGPIREEFRSGDGSA